MKPAIRKLGTIDCDLVETTPVVFKDRLYRFEYVRIKYAANTTGDSYFRFVDHETGEYSKPFAAGYHLGNVMVEDDVLYVTGTNIWDGERVDLFRSEDMERWESWNALDLPGYGLFNTSLCRDDNGYILMFEVGKPAEVAGVRFTARFAVSSDLTRWELTPPECTYAKDRYTAPTLSAGTGDTTTTSTSKRFPARSSSMWYGRRTSSRGSRALSIPSSPRRGMTG